MGLRRSKLEKEKRKREGFCFVFFKDTSAALSHYYRDLASRLRSMDVSILHNITPIGASLELEV